ncbi:gliding motility-associated C-terminal domain-containing protein [Pricia antarctica]|uniref:Gliding motility-associated C-terminal domain-containing protein n=1 Tax=Pricia antarctica TaxID=641691 RepID=A0A1G6X5H5_9FLAO|nr:T9SS type B sorting domain-containing protein [Pricia antarctica]SDD73369.1 gliding motility-associated C-terminal domain-containing protein [Pricia antarctica]
MSLTRPTKKQCLLFFALFIGSLYASYAQEVAPFAPRLDGGNIEIRGDIIFVGNNILNRATQSDPGQANTPYNGNNNNNSLWMEYIDIDGDPSTFSSSSAELNIADPACSQVRYAGLYWAATYPNERSTNGGASFSGTPRIEDWFNIKFQVPGGSYVDLTADTTADPAGQEDDIIYDGYNYSNINNSFKDSPYICYKNVTDLVRGNTNPNGEYTVANVRATKGKRNGSSSAGWVMVIIYENPNESGKFISTFDGYAGMSGAVGNVDVAVNGFRTLPTPFPVRARIGVGALEGDRGIKNDRFRIKANSASGGFTQLSNGPNPGDNFFNSTITTNGNQVPTRTPYGTNTLGTDLDLFNLNNPSNSVLPNGESGATIRFTSNGDGYGAFLTTFAVEIIEPNIILEKRVEDIAGNDITDGGVNLGQTLDYVLSFRNLGNDDAENYSIRDVLPTNTTFVSFDVSGAPGVTASYDVSTNEIDFTVPDNRVEIGDPAYTIRLRVKVASNCFDFVDACSDQIQNLAYSTYRGEINSATITDDPSVSDFDNCGFVTPGATNFLLDDLSDCTFTRTVELCGANTILFAGEDFDSYVWVRDDNNNGQIDGSDTIMNDGDPDNDPSTLLVDDIGTYIVDKIIPDPCKGFKEIIIVERFGNTQTNPIIDYFNKLNGDTDSTNDIQGEIVTCSVDGDLMPKIFLCGTNDSQLMQVNITDAQSLVWERLDESSIGVNGCTASANDCANKNLSCGWNQVDTGNNYTADTAGKYRLVINYTGGCFSRFYFDVFQNSLDILYNNRDIICDRDGRIQITNLGSNYGYQLVDHANNTILVPFSAGHGPSFDFGTGENGSYRVEVVQLDDAGAQIPGACIFSTEPIGVRDRDFQVDITTTPANCNAQGSIKIDVLNVRADYTYRLLRSDGTLIDDETAQPNNTYTFTVNPGNYTIETSTADGCTDSQNITVDRIPNPTLSGVTMANIACSAGTIELTRTGGQGNPDFLYAIWSMDGTDLYPNIPSIPADAYQVSSTFNFGWRDDNGDGDDEYISGEDGTYEFVIIDANNCFAFSNPVTINDNGPTIIDTITETQPSCSGDNDGALTINVSGGVAPYEYSIDNGATYQTTPNFVNLRADTYAIRVTDASGCDVSQTYNLIEPFPMSASAGVSRDATCDPMGAEVRVTNVVGGNGSYQYSFDGGATYGASTIAVLPPGDYTVIVSDGSCEFPMAVTVEDVPDEPTVTLTPEVSYLCNGRAVVTATPDIATYNYTYYLDGVLNSPDPTSNVFPNVPPGTYIVSTNYSSQTPPTPSLLLQEDFGYGTTIPNPNTSGYFYENQQDNVTPSGAPIDNGAFINDYEYAVTSNIERPFGAWWNPEDHTSGDRLTQGRYLVINIGAPTPGQVIYQKPINDIIHNQPISVSLWLTNLIRSGNRVAPDLTIELRHPTTNALVTSSNTGAVPENVNWNEYVLSLNPGANSSLNLVIVTNESEVSGNDVAIDDITVYQTPEVCELSVETPVTVEAAKVFTANITASSSVSCNGLNDASITFEVENFEATSGFDYSLDGGTTWINSISSPVTTTAPLGAGTQRIDIRKANETTCTTFVEQTITQPNALIAGGSVTTPYTCANGGATITASVSGGTPTYQYQLEDTVGTPIGSFDFATNGNNTVFAGLAPGDYFVRVRDNNTCENAAAVTVNDTAPVVFDVDPTSCYTGGNSASIQVNVTDGNGWYLFRINGGPWITPSPANATTHTFNNLANGNYDIEVKDALGCPNPLPAPTSVSIDPQLTVSASAPNITACATDTDISISTAGGDTNYAYAVIPNGNTVADSDFSTANPFTVSAAGDYDVYVRDNNGNPGYCSAMHTITVAKDAPIDITATPTAVTCFGASNGAISIAVNSGGNGPFMYSIDNGATYVSGNSFQNLAAGTYPIRVRDANLCESVPEDAIVTEPAQLVAEAVLTQNYTCLVDGEITVGSVTSTSGGSGDYQYSINGSTWTASTTVGHTFANLTDGTYSVRVRDANATNCGMNLPNIVIDPLPTEPTLTRAVSYNCDGSGNITITPFDASFTYSLDGTAGVSGAGANIFNNVTLGIHTVTVNYGRACTTDINAIVADGNAFEASITASENLDCNGDASGTITIDADNFGAGGYEYSLNGAAFVGPFTTAEQLTGLSAAAHTIDVRDVDNAIAGMPGCTVPLSRTLTEPAAMAASASITEQLTCTNGGATITASATGGTPTYIYQLEDTGGTAIASYDFATNGNNTAFSGLAAGDYIVRVRDTNGCEDEIDTALTVDPTQAITFDVTPVACYSGANDGTIVVNVTDGNGGYQFRIDGGPWITPSLASATTYTFENLADGTYGIEVRDSFGCPSPLPAPQTATVAPQLVTSVDVLAISACNDGSITVNATGGNGILVYAIVPANTSPSGLYTTTSSLVIDNAAATSNPAGYDVYVLDDNGSGTCAFVQEDILLTPVASLTVSGTPTDPECYDGLGAIDATVGGGTGPFTYDLVDLSPADGIDYGTSNANVSTTSLAFNGIGVGDYEITITDVNSCTVTSSTITINNAVEITANISPLLPTTCTSTTESDYGFEFLTVTAPTGTVEYSNDGGTTWQASNELRGTVSNPTFSGTSVYPSIRVTLASGTVCQKDFPRYLIPYPLDNLDISISAIVVNCNDLQVRVQGTAGVAPYEYSYAEDPANFNPGTATWQPGGTIDSGGNTVTAGDGLYNWTGLTPGRTYVFYVRDNSGCVRQSLINVNDLIAEPIEITVDVTPSCFNAAPGVGNGEITFTLNPSASSTHIRWEVFELGNATPIQVSGGGASAVNIPYNNTITATGLAEGEYYVQVVQSDGTTDTCTGGSENALVDQLNAITATPVVTRNISCNLPGLISINGINGGGGPAYTFDVTGPAGFTALTGLNSNPVQIPINSPVGNYTVTINDQYGCPVALAPVALTLSPNPTITSVTQDNCNAPIALTVVGASAAGNIRYAIVPAGDPVPTTYLDNNGVFNSVAPGSYDVYIIDGNGCTNSQAAFVVHPVLSAKTELTKVLDCTASPEATISIEALTGSGSYEYSITNTAGAPAVVRTAFGGSAFDYFAPSAGDYTITIYDTNTPDNTGCNRAFVVTVPARIEPVVANITATDITCIGDTDGTITISAVDNGVGPYSFEITSLDGAATSINPTNSTNTTATFAGLAPTIAAGYIVTVTADAGTNNCSTDSAAITIAEPSTIVVTLDPIVEFACATGNNDNDASISVAGVAGGSNTFVRYEFINDQGTAATGDDVVVQNGTNTVYTETDTDGGTYIVNVYDNKGCVGSTTATILPFVEISDPTVTVDSDVTCNPGDDAQVSIGITLNPVTGTPNIEYAVAGTDNAYNAPNQASNIFTALGIGNYEVTVTNTDTGCFVQTTFELENPNNFEIITTTVDVECHGTDGSVSFTINDPVNPYSNGFTWQIYDSQGTAAVGDDVPIVGANGIWATFGPTTPFAIGAGEYRVEVAQDSNPLCVASEFFTIAGPSDPITADRDVNPITCIGNDGVIEIIDVLGGWGGYEYYVGTTAPASASVFVTNPRFDTLSAGTYQAWVIDQNGCQTEVQSNIILDDPTPITADLQINQANCTNFEGEIEVNNVLGGQGSNYTYQLIKDGMAIRAPQNTRVFSGLDAGIYEVQITDQWTCMFTTSPAEILFEPISPLATVVKTIDCSTTDSGGQITITQTGGSGNFDYIANYPDGFTSAFNSTGVFTGLNQVGDYVFTITDQDAAQACPTYISQRLETAVQPVMSIDTFMDVTCNGADDGTISVSVPDNGVGPYTFEITSGPGSSTAFPIAATSSTATTATFNGLEGTASGITYTIRATGINACTDNISQQIVQPDAIANVNATVTEFLCAAGNNSNHAVIAVDPTAITGGSGSYVRYEFINTTTTTTVQNGASASYTETDVAGGAYTINVYDDKGCVGTTTTTILPFVEISLPTVTTTQNVACSPLNNAEIEVGITVTPATATPNLVYTLTGIGSTVYPTQTISSMNNPETFAGLEFGTYSVSITNTDTGCVINTVHKINNPDTIKAIATKLTDEECLNNGIDDGSFSLEINDYSGDYSYQVYDRDDNAVVGFSGTGNTSTVLPPVTGLPGGVYYVRVTATNAPRCDDNSNYFTINAPSATITATVREEANVTCSNDQGKIFIDPTGGKGPYTIHLENTDTSQVYNETNVSAFIFEGLAAGDFNVTITDAFGCVFSDTYELIRPDDIVPTIAQTPLTCFDGNTASIATSIGPRTNPTAPVYEYQLLSYGDNPTNTPQQSAFQPSASFTGLSAGFYRVFVKDNVSCSDESNIIEIVNPTEVEAALIRTSPLTCATGVELELSATGGSGIYEYSTDKATWNPMTGNSANLPLSGMLSAGVYQYYVRDAANSCAAVLSNSIEEDIIENVTLIVDKSAAVINCNGDNTAIIYASATGGLGNYEYSLYTNASLSAASRVAGPQADGEFSGLAMGSYYVNVTSGNAITRDCTAPAEEVIITEPDSVSVVKPDDFTNVSCNGASDGTITVELTGGVGPYQYAISPNLNKFENENTFEDLAAGAYRVIATDRNGCFVYLDYTIIEPDVLEVTPTVLAEVCEGEENGSIELSIIGGTSPYSTRLNSETNFVQGRTVVSDLASGSYIVFVRDAMGCEEFVSVTIDPGVNLNASVEPVYGCEDNIPSNYINIVLNDASISQEVLYALDSEDLNDMQLNPFFRDIAPGTHYIAISHANGCIVTHSFEIEDYEPLTISVEQSNINELTATVNGGKEEYTIYFGDKNNGSDNTFIINRTDTYVVTVLDENGCEASANIFIEFIDIDIPNFFSPNGDAENQYWKPQNDEGFPQILTIIFDRYGREVYRIGQGDRGWDGFYQQNELPTGDYWYIIKLNGENDDREFVGHFTLYR